ncbi:MAG: SCO family protein [Gammaproteobacteria bacterium]
MLNARTLLTLTVITGLIGIGAAVGIYTSGYNDTRQSPEAVDGLLWPEPKQIQEFTIVDHTGEEFGLENLKGKWSFLFFGYTYCPDVCPITLSVLDKFYSNHENDDVQVLLITVDPERDTPARLAEYTGYFNEDFIGLGGSMEQINSLAAQIGISYMYHPPDEDGSYLVDHTSAVFLLDPQARLVSIFSAPHNPAAIRSRFNQIETFIRDQGDY